MSVTKTSAETALSLSSCSPRALADALVDARGEEEGARILKEAFRLLQNDININADVDVDVDVDATDDGTGVVSPDEKRNNVDNDNANDNIHDNDGTHQEQDHLLGKALLQEPFDASFLSPRMGKFSLQVHERGVVATKKNDPTVQLTIFRDSTSSASSTTNTTNSSCSHVLVFPKPEDCKAIVYNRKIDALQSRPKKVNGSLMLLQFESPLQLEPRLSKKPSLQLCFALPFDAKTKGPVGPSLVVAEGEETQVDTEIETADNNNNDNNDNNDPTEAWGKLLHRALGGKLVQVLKGSSSSLPSSGGEPTASTRTCRNAGCGDGDDVNFESYQPPNTSTTTAGMPFVGCYLGVNDGVLYPLREGLLFYKPPRFLPRTSLHSIACGRGGSGGDSSSRYVDMVIQCSNSKNSSSNSNSSNNDDNDDDNDNDTSSVNTMSTSDAAHVGSTHSHNSARRRIARFGSFDSTGSSGSSAFRAVPRMIGLRPIITKKPTPTRSAIARREHHRSSKRNDVVHLPVLLRRRPVADFSFDETNGEIPDHLLFPIL
mmetsp:Transcript_8471/g.16382  ORF Transcript_8471/g.16382 Transcript_8471/m.16382 type:complete len:544 (-) Transcript_8471:202-1833(-)